MLTKAIQCWAFERLHLILGSTGALLGPWQSCVWPPPPVRGESRECATCRGVFMQIVTRRTRILTRLRKSIRIRTIVRITTNHELLWCKRPFNWLIVGRRVDHQRAVLNQEMSWHPSSRDDWASVVHPLHRETQASGWFSSRGMDTTSVRQYGFRINV